MAGRPLRRTSVLGAAVAAMAMAIGAGVAIADAAGGLTGSPAAVSVAEHVLAHSRHVPAIRWTEGGDQWECPSPDGPVVGPAPRRPERGCRRAVVTYEENLHRGRIIRSLATTTAPGLATTTELISHAGAWMRSGRARCWDAEGGGVVNVPAFTYAGERLSITAWTSEVITLHGVDRDARETDTIDAHTFAVREVDLRVPGISGSAELVGRLAEKTRHFALPRRPRRICSDIVRFPPHPANGASSP